MKVYAFFQTSPVEYKDVALAQVVQIMLHYFVINTVGRTSAEQEFVARIFDDANAVFSRIDALKGRVDEVCAIIRLLDPNICLCICINEDRKKYGKN